jgi:hypothetical protein
VPATTTTADRPQRNDYRTKGDSYLSFVEVAVGRGNRVSLYFAYGSNMAAAELRRRVPGAVLKGGAYLPDHRLRFSRRSRISRTGVADVVYSARMRTWGVVFDVPDSGMDELDLKEGVGIGAYERRSVEVAWPTGGDRLTVETYTVLRKEPQEISPSVSYVARMLVAAGEHGLPESYLAFLRWLHDEASRAVEGRPFREGLLLTGTHPYGYTVSLERTNSRRGG